MKRVVIIAVLAFAAIWPLVQLALVQRHGINSWKFAGWAMYATAEPPVLSALLEKSPSGPRLIDATTLPAPVRDAKLRFEARRRMLGDFHSPEALGAAVLEARPDLTSVMILVQRSRLDPSTAKMVTVQARYEYRREELGD